MSNAHSHAFPTWTPVTIPIAGSAELYPVRRIYCVGRNYAEHAREMGFDPEREEPFFFCKPGDDESIIPVPTGTVGVVPYPPATQNYHFEAELVAAIGATCNAVAANEAMKYVYGFAAGLDMTRRDLQMNSRKLGRPWEVGKSFDFSAPVGPITPVNSSFNICKSSIELTVKGERRQYSELSQMIWPVDEIVSKLSHLFTLRPGDLVFTGTPAGVGPTQAGDVLQVTIPGLESLSVKIV